MTSALEHVRWLFLDVDGVLTDGTVEVDADGRESKRFSIRDGLGLVLLLKAGIEVGLISGRPSPAAEARARDLGIRHVRMACRDKVKAYEEIQAGARFEDREAAFCGDDLPDLPLLRRVGVPCCPADAHPLVRAVAAIVLNAPGGHGAVRELAEEILRARGLFDVVVRERFGS